MSPIDEAFRRFVNANSRDRDKEFDTLLGLLQRYLVQLIYRILDDPEDTQDVLQQVLINVAEKAKATHIDSISAYARQTAVNTALNANKFRRRRPSGNSVPFDDLEESYVQGLAAEEPEDGEYHRKLRAALPTLRPRDQLLLNAVMNEATIEQISERLGIKKASVLPSISRAKRNLRKAIEKR